MFIKLNESKKIKVLAFLLSIVLLSISPETVANTYSKSFEKETSTSFDRDITMSNIQSGEKVTIKAGTPIDFTLKEGISSKNLNEGDAISLKVSRDVSVNGKVVIPYGAIAKGKVSYLKKRKIAGIGAKMEVTVTSVQSVDGTTIFITDSKVRSEGANKQGLAWGLFAVSFLFLWPLVLSPLFVKGKHAEMKEGKSITGYIASKVTVTVSE